MIQAEAVDAGKEIEEIRRWIAFHEEEVRRHPLAARLKRGTLPAETEKAFACYLFNDSWMWPPMLAAMRDRARHPKLRQAIEDNRNDESGGRGTSHITLCVSFLRSVGVAPALTDPAELNRTVNIATRMTEAQIAGWLAAAEMLTAPLYDLANECFAGKPGVDTRYLDVHRDVDQEHVAWLWAAVEALVSEKPCREEILQGAGLGARATLKSLDEIYEESFAAS